MMTFSHKIMLFMLFILLSRNQRKTQWSTRNNQTQGKKYAVYTSPVSNRVCTTPGIPWKLLDLSVFSQGSEKCLENSILTSTPGILPEMIYQSKL